MTPKMETLKKIMDVGVVAVVRAESADQAIKIAEACKEGGIPAIEITFTVPYADEVIRELAKAYQDSSMIIGAGTVLDAATARIAILAGAQYVVSPCLDEETIKLCKLAKRISSYLLVTKFKNNCSSRFPLGFNS